MVRMVRMVRSLADRTFQLWCVAGTRQTAWCCAQLGGHFFTCWSDGEVWMTPRTSKIGSKARNSRGRRLWTWVSDREHETAWPELPGDPGAEADPAALYAAVVAAHRARKAAVAPGAPLQLLDADAEADERLRVPLYCVAAHSPEAASGRPLVAVGGAHGVVHVFTAAHVLPRVNGADYDDEDDEDGEDDDH